jgi:hypothetical protein
MKASLRWWRCHASQSADRLGRVLRRRSVESLNAPGLTPEKARRDQERKDAAETTTGREKGTEGEEKGSDPAKVVPDASAAEVVAAVPVLQRDQRRLERQREHEDHAKGQPVQKCSQTGGW